MSELLSAEPTPDLASAVAPSRASRVRFQVYAGAPTSFWRLLGGNNRAYGRSFGVLTSVAQAQQSCLLAVAAAASGTVELTSAGGRAWTWLLMLDGEPVARSDSPYGRRIECRASAARFREVAPVATVTVVRFIPHVEGPTPRVSLATVARSPRCDLRVHGPLGR
ncbi:MAG: hypothetical protein ABI890_11600 [Lapillicoccus sp.]